MSKPIPQKGSPYWHYDFQIKGARFYGSTHLTSKRAAQAYIDRLRSQIMLPDIKRPPLTLDEACGLYQDHAESLDSWPKVEYMLVALTDGKTGLGKGKLLSEINQRDLIAYIARRRVKDDGSARANSSVNRELDTIRAIWNRAKAARYDVGEMPDWKALRLKQTRLAHRVLSEMEDDQLFDQIRDDVRPAVYFLFLSGWRRAEVVGLRWSDVDMGNRVATTRIKGGDIITRPLTQAMIILIANQPKICPFIFTYVCQRTCSKIRVKGRRYPLTITVLRQTWEAAREGAQLESNIRIHDLRHTRATRMLRATGNLGLVKDALKHRNIKTTLQYAHVLDDEVRAGLEASESRNSPETQIRKKHKT